MAMASSRATLLLILCLLVCVCSGGVASSQAEASSDVCSSSGSCTSSSSKAKEFWAEMRRQGLKLNIKRKIVPEKPYGGLPARNRTAMVLSDDVFYGRAIIKIPRQALLGLETTSDKKLRDQASRFLFEDRKLELTFNITENIEDYTHLLSVAYPLIAENRDPNSVFREWLDAARSEKLFALHLTHRQLKVLKGTTVEGADEEMVFRRDLIESTASNFSTFRKKPVTRDEAAWALAVIMRHARIVHPHQDAREARDPRMHLFPLVELLDIAMNPEAGTAITFQEEIILDGKREEDVVLQIARRDMPKGEEVFVWPGRLSNSEMVARHGFPVESNPIGIGRNVSIPAAWRESKNTKERREFDLYNCSNLEAFELRLSPRGYPMRNFVRCYRVGWFITNGWYSPGLKSRIRELNKWPPPSKYTKDDWLSWTQADAEINRVILDYCQHMRQQLKETMDAATADDFRNSKDPVDRVLWSLRSEESRTFKNCVNVAKDISH
mmetsp:Transcript_23212/g.41922  ORF Transcript_23212/g.41922 Transcript_23212/m.41922 type:complete len:496 (-) Transcript_23212:37-1524(-)|eukprot:CAMPEP_0197662706 /NCGR_PEP_ID=MMETSP1338-20131121/54437_1 /TAXON_ID=43686 ORGANISM="Pelagodinium beii, Strain RCC1491" /NCGR_SAMPLE_ID=MMETSP1338 /ASSEMBLY_ACC=CAM_ASM_000754 /LENGTH=495 /DNA_ID=CAMNT_0043240659 /DNA_START=32 /DNA_END=1519 /DNA_ORIENTATION=+